eukprot:5083634-Prymnesium_polylepis.1
MARAYKADGEWTAGDVCCDSFSACPARRRPTFCSRTPLIAGVVGSIGVIDVLEMRVSDRREIEGRSRAAEGPLKPRAGPVAQLEPRRRKRKLLPPFCPACGG